MPLESQVRARKYLAQKFVNLCKQLRQKYGILSGNSKKFKFLPKIPFFWGGSQNSVHFGSVWGPAPRPPPPPLRAPMVKLVNLSMMRFQPVAWCGGEKMYGWYSAILLCCSFRMVISSARISLLSHNSSDSYLARPILAFATPSTGTDISATAMVSVLLFCSLIILVVLGVIRILARNHFHRHRVIDCDCETTSSRMVWYETWY